jgi:hypothetical protein
MLIGSMDNWSFLAPELDEAGARSLLKATAGGCYVYVLWSSAAGKLFPFYVGMGRGDRALRHRQSSARVENRIKAAMWRRCIQAGGQVLYSFPLTRASEDDAKAKERDLIAVIGRRMNCSGPLANLTDGGEGVTGIIQPKGAGSKLAKPLVAEGQSFPSWREASAALGLSRPTIVFRIRNGWPGYSYPDGPHYPNKKGRRSGDDNHKSRAVIAQGKQYPTLTAAAEALGVFPPAILRRITRGWPGYFYEDEGQRPQLKPHRKYPVWVEGTRYEHMVAAARATGISHAVIRYRIARSVRGYRTEAPQ